MRQLHRPGAVHTSVYEDASVSEHLLEWLVNVLPTGFAETAGDAACGVLMSLMACVRYRGAGEVSSTAGNHKMRDEEH